MKTKLPAAPLQILCLVLGLAASLAAQTHFTFTPGTGNNMTVLISSSIEPTFDGAPLDSGDEIGVFAPSGLCVGAVVWEGANAALTVWGDNELTPIDDGIAAGAELHFKIWDESRDIVLPAQATYNSGGPGYSVDGIAVLASLTASAQAALLVQSPSGGDALNAGTEWEITWNYLGPVDQVKLEYSTGGSWTLLADSLAVAHRSYLWTVPDDPSSSARVRVSDVGGAAEDVSDGFSILATSHFSFLPGTGNNMTVMVPAGINPMVDRDSIEPADEIGVFSAAGLCVGGGRWTGDNLAITVWGNDPLTPEVDGMGIGEILHYRVWDASAEAEYEVEVAYASGGPDYTVDGLAVLAEFVSPGAVITVLTPNGGEEFIPGDSVLVTWDYEANISEVTLEYTTGGDWKEIAAGVPADSFAYWWMVPDELSMTAKVRVSETGGELEDQSDEVFSILSSGDRHFGYASGTGNNMTVLVPLAIDPTVNWEPLEPGDEIGVFSTAGLCAGAVIWYGGNTAITVWGDDDQTPETDGLEAGDTLLLKVWDASLDQEFDVEITYATGGPDYSADGIAVLASLNSPPVITLTAPNGGERWETGSDEDITWEYHGNIALVTLEYKPGDDWMVIADSVSASDLSYTWTVPDTVSSTVKVRVSDRDNPGLEDQSDEVFSIRPRRILTLLAPNGGEQWEVGAHHDITWEHQGDIDLVTLEYKPGADWIVIADSVPTGELSYTWTVPGPASPAVRLRVIDAGDYDVRDRNDEDFEITAVRTITLLAPTGGEECEAGSEQEITWSFTGVISSIRLDLDVGDGWEQIATDIPASDLVYLWIVPDTESSVARIRISDAADVNIRDWSGDFFNITQPVSIKSGSAPEFTFAVSGQGILFAGARPAGKVDIKDLKGMTVRSLSVTGIHCFWDGLDNRGRPAAPGVYLISLGSGGKDRRLKAFLSQ